MTPCTPTTTPRWVTDLLGDEAVCTRVIGGGTSRITLLLDVPPHPGGVVARHDPGIGPLAGTPFTLRREADVFRAATAADVPVPAVIAIADDGMSFAVDEVAGAVDRRGDAIDDYLRILGALHSTGLAHVPTDHAGFDAAGRDDLAVWRQIATERITRSAPLVHRALDVLDQHHLVPADQVAFCHGDAGFGNYLHSGRRVTGLVDWEMAHTGDPHDDLASIAIRAVLTGTELGDLRARIGWHWEPASGLRFDPARYLVGVVATLTRMVISCLAALDRPHPDVDRTTQLMGLPVMEAQLVRHLARLDGASLPALDVLGVRDGGDDTDPAFVAEVERLLAEPSPTGADAGVARRRAYLADQLASRRAAGDSRGADHRDRRGDVDDLGEIARQVAARLAVVPASAALAAAPIPEVPA